MGSWIKWRGEKALGVWLAPNFPQLRPLFCPNIGRTRVDVVKCLKVEARSIAGAS